MQIVVPDTAQSIIEQNVPLKVRARLVPLVKKGYLICHETIKRNPELNWELGYFHQGYIRLIAVSYVLNQAIQDKKIPFHSRIVYNMNHSYKFLELTTDNVVITISQVKYPNKTARPAFFRKRYQQANQTWLNFDKEPVQINKKPYYLLLTHGHGGLEPGFINLGMPDITGRKWQYKINLLTELHQVKLDDEPIFHEENVVQEEDLIRFREVVQGVQESESK